MDVTQIHDETLFGNSRQYKVGLEEYVQNINQQISIINIAPESYSKEQSDSLLFLESDKTELIDSYSKTEYDVLLLLKADKSNTCTKTETDTMLDENADKTDIYTKTDNDALLFLKTDKFELIDAYSKSEDDTILLMKANVTDIVDSYSNIENDALQLLKANVADLTSYVDLTSAQTISGQKQFGVISASSISKLNKNDESILLAGEGDILVNSLITQPQLYDVRDIATGKSQAYVFSTQGELNHWMAVQENNVKLASETYAGDEVQTKLEDDALQLLKDDKMQLIDSPCKSETYARNEVYTKDNKANQQTRYSKSGTYARDNVYIKTETNQLISQIDVGDDYLTYYYSKTKIDELLDENADATELSNYMTLDTAQTIKVNKTFNNACRFISSVDGMSAVTGSPFVKSGADDTVVQLGAGGIKLISEFNASIDDSNYVKKYDYVQDIQGILRKTTLGQQFLELTDANYITLGSVKNEFVSSIYSSSISGNITAIQFIKSGGTDQQVLLANGTTEPLSELGSGGVTVKDLTKQIQVNPKQESFAPSMKIKKGTLPTLIAPTASELCMAVGGPYDGCKISYQLKVRQLCCLFFDYKMSNVYIDEALLEAAGQSEFPEQYAYIHEREPKPIVDGIANQIIVGPQYLQDQVIDKDDKLNVQPIPQSIVPIEIPQVQIFKIPKRQLAPNVQIYNPANKYFYFYKLRNKVVYNIGLNLNNDFMGFVFTDFPEELWQFSIYALVLGDDVRHKQDVMGYISEKGFYLGVSIGSVDQVTSIKGNTHIAIAGVYCTYYEPLKRATRDANGDGKINIIEDWHINSIIDRMKSMSWVQDVVQKQMEAIDDGIQPYDPSQPVSLSNYLNSNTKLVNNNTFGPLRAAYFVKEGPICTFNFQAEVSNQHVSNVFKVFQTTASDLQHRLTKFFPINTSYTSFAGMIQTNGNDTPDVVANQGLGYYPMGLCDFSGNCLIDPQPQESNQNNITSNGLPISHIDKVIRQHNTFPSVPIPTSAFLQYTVAEVSRDQLFALVYTPYDLDEFKIQIIDDTVNKLTMFNIHLRQKWFIETEQDVLSMSQSIDPKRTILFSVMILYDFNTDPIQYIPSAYLTVADTDYPVRWYNYISPELKADKFVNYYISGSYFNLFLSIVLTANVQFDHKFEGSEEYNKDGTVLLIGLKSTTQIIREYTIYHRTRTIDGTLYNDSTTEQFIYNTVKPRTCGTYVTMIDIEDAIKDQVSVPYTMPIRFRLSIPLDDILIFSGFTDYPNSLFGDLKIKFKTNPNAFVFALVNSIISTAKYQTMNKTDPMASGPDKLKNIDVLFRNWSL
ncbi:MAG: hypothetical protein EZS28_003097 [Streblomastix strix]|uniref:Uncharacterized protein n=1 Tax=Streblomastix strix TaxID=222440 RepID=A0A5J4X2B9_9EUKA|nr:MAG: hypothetical protein EZS28_003097 [Streblomastix strix]